MNVIVMTVIFECYGRLSTEMERKMKEQRNNTRGSDRATDRTVASGSLLGLDRLLRPYGPGPHRFLPPQLWKDCFFLHLHIFFCHLHTQYENTFLSFLSHHIVVFGLCNLKTHLKKTSGLHNPEAK